MPKERIQKKMENPEYKLTKEDCDKLKITKESKPILLGDSINISGEVEIRNGDTVIRAKNKFVSAILAHISNTLVFGRLTGGYWRGPLYDFNAFNMYLGTNTVTPTVYNTSALTSPIGTPPGTPPNNKIGSTSNPSNGVFRMSTTATWNAGTVSGTVGEMALYFNLATVLNGYQWGAAEFGDGSALGSRLSVADGSISSFVIDNTKPLAVTWTITVSFA